jgi:hypothetical protein
MEIISFLRLTKRLELGNKLSYLSGVIVLRVLGLTLFLISLFGLLNTHIKQSC